MPDKYGKAPSPMLPLPGPHPAAGLVGPRPEYRGFSPVKPLTPAEFERLQRQEEQGTRGYSPAGGPRLVTPEEIEQYQPPGSYVPPEKRTQAFGAFFGGAEQTGALPPRAGVAGQAPQPAPPVRINLQSFESYIQTGARGPAQVRVNYMGPGPAPRPYVVSGPTRYVSPEVIGPPPPPEPEKPPFVISGVRGPEPYRLQPPPEPTTGPQGLFERWAEPMPTPPAAPPTEPGGLFRRWLDEALPASTGAPPTPPAQVPETHEEFQQRTLREHAAANRRALKLAQAAAWEAADPLRAGLGYLAQVDPAAAMREVERRRRTAAPSAPVRLPLGWRAAVLATLFRGGPDEYTPEEWSRSLAIDEERAGRERDALLAEAQRGPVIQITGNGGAWGPERERTERQIAARKWAQEVARYLADILDKLRTARAVLDTLRRYPGQSRSGEIQAWEAKVAELNKAIAVAEWEAQSADLMAKGEPGLPPESHPLAAGWAAGGGLAQGKETSAMREQAKQREEAHKGWK